MTPVLDHLPGHSTSHSGPVSEVEAIQSPALGAYLLWRMGASFQSNSPDAPRIDLHFLVLPLLLHAGTLTVISSTNPASGLSKLVHKMLDTESELIAVNARAVALRELTLASLSLGVATGLLAIDHEAARVYSLDTNRKPGVTEGVKQMERGAERIGAWFAQLPKEQVFSMLRVAY
jgi:hypothetical protein